MIVDGFSSNFTVDRFTGQYRYNKPVQFLNNQNSKAAVCDINCSLINVRSVCNKIPILHEYIHNNNLDICFLTETWIRHEDTQIPSILAPDGFSSHILSRDDKLGGGLAVIFNTKLKIKKCETPKLKSMECIHMKIVGYSHLYLP